MSKIFLFLKYMCWEVGCHDIDTTFNVVLVCFSMPFQLIYSFSDHPATIFPKVFSSFFMPPCSYTQVLCPIPLASGTGLWSKPIHSLILILLATVIGSGIGS